MKRGEKSDMLVHIAAKCWGESGYEKTPALPMRPVIITCTTEQVGFLSLTAALPTSVFDSREACTWSKKSFRNP